MEDLTRAVFHSPTSTGTLSRYSTYTLGLNILENSNQRAAMCLAHLAGTARTH
jgi:hypothetical protein